MAPTICSGKKRQTRTIATTNIRRHAQGPKGPHQLNQAFSNIVNFIAKDSRVPVSLRNQTHSKIVTTGNYPSTNSDADLVYSYLMQTSGTSASNHRLQPFTFITDNAVTSSTHSDTENSLDLRLANEILNTDSTTTYGSNANTNASNITSLSPSSSLSETTLLSSHKEKMSSPKSQRQASFFQKHSTNTQHIKLISPVSDGSDNEENLYENYENKLNLNEKITETHSGNKRKLYFSCKDIDSEDDELERVRALTSDLSSYGSDTDMETDETDETDSMTSLDTEKSAKLKRGNHPLLRDKLFAKHPTDNENNNSNTKSCNNLRNTDGLLSIAIKTIKLVKRNQLLQQKLTQLQLETSEFIQSVLANPENRHFRENIKPKA